MENNNYVLQTAEEVGYAAGSLGRGLLAGLVGTAAITLSQMIEMQITGREQSETPAEAVEKVFPVETENQEQKEKLSIISHWAYGTTWGLFRGMLDVVGIHGWKATSLHFGAVTGTAMTMLPGLDVAPPVKEWGKQQIAVDTIHHAVYAIAAGIVYDSIRRPDR
jgi:hypothetical protein